MNLSFNLFGYRINQLLLAGLFIWFSSCSSRTTEQKVDLDYRTFQKELIKNDKVLNQLFGFTVKVNAVKGDQPLITKLGYEFSNGDDVTLPAFRKGTTDIEIKKSPFYGGVDEFIELQNGESLVSRDSVLSLCLEVTEFAHRVEAYDISSSNRLGRFIIFTISPTERIIYAPDLDKVKTDYWRNFISKCDIIDTAWYYKKTKLARK